MELRAAVWRPRRHYTGLHGCGQRMPAAPPVHATRMRDLRPPSLIRIEPKPPREQSSGRRGDPWPSVRPWAPRGPRTSRGTPGHRPSTQARRVPATERLSETFRYCNNSAKIVARAPSLPGILYAHGDRAAERCSRTFANLRRGRKSCRWGRQAMGSLRSKVVVGPAPAAEWDAPSRQGWPRRRPSSAWWRVPGRR